MSIVSGMIELGGCGKYLSREKSSFRSVEGTLICKTTTVQDSLDLFNTKLKPYISLDALSHPTATHVVVQIYWGAIVPSQSQTKTAKITQSWKLKGILCYIKKIKPLFSIAGNANTEYNEEEII